MYWPGCQKDTPSLPISCFALPSRNLAISLKEQVAVQRQIRRDSIRTHVASAMEAAAALDTMRVMKIVTDSNYARGMELLEAIVAMLTKMT